MNFAHIVAGTAPNIETVSAGQNIPVGTNIIELNQVFANASAVALASGINAAGGGSTYNLVFPVNIPKIYSKLRAIFNGSRASSPARWHCT
jgi:hypothetical protein